MSVDPMSLKVGDRVVFSRRAVKKVSRLEYSSSIDGRPDGISFSDGDHLEMYSSFWELAELVAELPKELMLAKLDGAQYRIDSPCYYYPGHLLGILQQDVARLKAAGVEVIGVEGV